MFPSSPLNNPRQPNPSGRPGGRTTYAYDLLNRLIMITDPLGQQSILDDDAASSRKSTGPVTTFIYDFLKQTIVVVDPLGNRTTTTYDAGPVQDADPPARITTVGCHERGWLDIVAGGHTTTYSYPAAGEADPSTSKIHGGRTLATYRYDDDARLVAYTDESGKITSYAHDSGSDVIGVENANQHTTGDAKAPKEDVARS